MVLLSFFGVILLIIFHFLLSCPVHVLTYIYEYSTSCVSLKNYTCMSITWTLRLTLLSQILVTLKTVAPFPLWCVFAHNGAHVNTLFNQQLRVSQIGSQKWGALSGTGRIKWLMAFQTPYYSPFSLDLIYIVVYTRCLDINADLKFLMLIWNLLGFLVSYWDSDTLAHPAVSWIILFGESKEVRENKGGGTVSSAKIQVSTTSISSYMKGK